MEKLWIMHVRGVRFASLQKDQGPLFCFGCCAVLLLPCLLDWRDFSACRGESGGGVELFCCCLCGFVG